MPRAPRKCIDCDVRVVGKSRCPEHEPKPWATSTHSGSTRARRALRAQVLREEPRCRDCGEPSAEAGHIVPEAYGGKYERANLKGQCRACNVKQIRLDRAHRPS